MAISAKPGRPTFRSAGFVDGGAAFTLTGYLLLHFP